MPNSISPLLLGKQPPTAINRFRDEWPAALGDAAYQGLIGDVVQAISPITESDPAAILLQTLTYFGLIVGRGPHFRIEGDEHHANLFCLGVGVTSKARKGTSWGRVQEAFSRVDDPPRIVSGLSSGEGLKYNVRDGNDDDDPGVLDKRLLVFETEFCQVLRQITRAGNTLSATVRSAWDTGTLMTLTKNDPVVATNAHVAIVGHITVDELRRELTDTDAANGFMNRFIVMCVARCRRLPLGGGELPSKSVEEFGRRLSEAVVTARARRKIGMTDGAQKIWTGIYNRLSEGFPGLLGAVTARAEAQTLRLALVYALADKACAIDQQHLLAALAVWERAEASARYIFGAALGDAVADEILRAVRAGGKEGLTRTEISSLFKGHKSTERIGAALELLTRNDLVRRQTRAGPGRSAEVWYPAECEISEKGEIRGEA